MTRYDFVLKFEDTVRLNNPITPNFPVYLAGEFTSTFCDVVAITINSISISPYYRPQGSYRTFT